MVHTLVGAGGWGYFAGGLRSYAGAFRFVELNASFYRRIPVLTALGWRRLMPDDFVFAVKAHWAASHGAHLHATPAARDALAHDLKVARALRAPFVILETPASAPLGLQESQGLRELVGLVDSGGPQIGLEARAHSGAELPPDVRQTMEDLRVLDVVDLSKQTPRIPDPVVYTRLFGKGDHNVYEFDDEELRAIDRAGRDAVEVAFAFHGVRMYRDAGRFLTFRRTGTFPAVTDGVGIDSLRSVLREDARFPTSRAELIRDQGWKVFDLDATTRVHAREFLGRLPERQYASVEDVASAAQAAVPGSQD